LWRFPKQTNTTNVRFTKQIMTERLGAKKLVLSSIHRVKRVQKYGTFFDFSKRRISERYIILKVR
ncbi:TPA: hypothetical protein ACIRGM_002437, partial [Streptococcus suis]